MVKSLWWLISILWIKTYLVFWILICILDFNSYNGWFAPIYICPRFCLYMWWESWNHKIFLFFLLWCFWNHRKSNAVLQFWNRNSFTCVRWEKMLEKNNISFLFSDICVSYEYNYFQVPKLMSLLMVSSDVFIWGCYWGSLIFCSSIDLG